MDNKIVASSDRFVNEFNTRITFDGTKRGEDNVLTVSKSITDYSINFTISNGINSGVLTIPRPILRRGVYLIKSNSVERPLNSYYHREDDKLLDYVDVINKVLFDDITPYLTRKTYRGVVNSIKHLRFTNDNGNFIRGIYNIQKIISGIINMLPLYSTDMNAFVVNTRISIIDDAFDIIVDPAEKHKYQVDKNTEFFSKGWSSLGLADGSMADNNYMLSTDLRKLIPFGHNFHNPKRNLYSTLGMKGDETPLIMSKTMKDLKDLGITRTGWNLFTVFVDVPDVYEDQLMVDISHKDKYIDYDRKVYLYGEVTVSKGDTIHQGDEIAINTLNEKDRFKIPCDSAFVEDVTEEDTVVGGEIFVASVLHLKCRRFLKDGSKLTNLAANKGVIRLRELGYAIDPATGENRKIDVIVSSRAVLKRQNYTQILEAILNTVNNEQEIVIPDDASTSELQLEKALVQSGYREDGTWECETYAGKFDCVCGTVFWGVTHDAEDTLWQDDQPSRENGYGLRKAGLKFSTIEFRAIQTRFGKDSAIEDEILSYAQGGDEVEEYLCILDSKSNIESDMAKTVEPKDVNPVDVKETLMSENDLIGTFLDETILTDGFFLKLPVKYQTIIDSDYNVLSEGFPSEEMDSINDVEVFKQITIDKIYIPCYNVRKCWHHKVGKYGHSIISRAINDIIINCKAYEEEGFDKLSSIYRSVCTYYKIVSTVVGSKRGAISVLGMSVRYPSSAKAVATLSNDLPENTVEIHSNMANNVGVKTGDIVLVERFPCLGFVSVRPQYVQVTEDEGCRHTIRASGNSLGSLTLDFDGDVLYIASFHTEKAKKELRREMETPNELCEKYIKEFNESMGVPRYKAMALKEYKLSSFEPLTQESHADIVSTLSGVKNYTGPVVALAYNLLRVAETSKVEHDQAFNCGIEVFMNIVANSVFKQKHGVKSLHQVVTDAICTADVGTLVGAGFDAKTSEMLCNTIKEEAADLGITDLNDHHEKHLKSGRSNIITYIVRNNNKLYFASRSILDPTKVTHLVRNFEVVDLPSEMFSKISKRRKSFESDENMKNTVDAATKLVDIMLPVKQEEPERFFTINT